MENNSSQIALVKDLPSNANYVTELNGQLYFSANSVESRYELEPWTSDGTAAGTQMIRDLSPGDSSRPTGFIEFDGKIYFPANSNELWSTDGTSEGTNLVAEVNAGDGRFYTLNQFTEFNNRLYFVSSGGIGSDYELWSTDGTSEGIDLFEGVLPSSDILDHGSYSNDMIEFDDRLYLFATDNSGNNQGLWSIDGTTGGTSLITTDVIGVNGDFIEFDGKLYFNGYDESYSGTALWSSDGTEAGTGLFVNNSSLGELTEFNGRLYFGVTNESLGTELWSTDGTPEGTSLVANGYAPGELTEFNGRLYFNATDEVHGTELWSTDGMAEGTSLVADIIPGAENSSPVELVEFDNRLYFTITNNTEGTFYSNELWSSDGTPEGTNFVMNLHPGFSDISDERYSNYEIIAGGFGNLTVVDNELLFTAYDSESGTGLYKITADDAATNNIIGSDNDDEITGSAERDRLEGLNGEDILDGAAGNDTLLGGDGRDSLIGQMGNDIIYGGNKNDVLVGNEGDDILFGGNGFDTLEGGAGSDIFVLEPGQIKNTITDFDLGIDNLGLTDGLAFEDLTFEGNTVKLEGENLAQLDNINAENLTIENFVEL